MSPSKSDAKKPRASRVPYTPPVARRSATSNKEVPETQRTHDADRSSSASFSKRSPQEAADGDQSHRGSPEEQPAKQERVGASTGAEDNSGERRLEKTSANTCKPGPKPGPSTPGVDGKGPAKFASAGSEGRRKPRQAWAQYVPPGRRGTASSSESARSSAPESNSSKPMEESARPCGSSDPVGGREAPSQEAAPQRSSDVVVLDEPVVEEHASLGASITTSSLSLSDACGDDGNAEPALDPEECKAPVSSPSPHAETASTAVARDFAGTAPSQAVHRECQEGTETSYPPAAATFSGAAETPCEEEPTINTSISDAATSSTDSSCCRKEDQELPQLKPPAARYIPPGRRKALDAEAEAAAASGGGDGGAAGDGMGPLWTSRAPVRVSQRERATDGDASPARPAPARVARVVGGGMSAYGANISEYSGEFACCTYLGLRGLGETRNACIHTQDGLCNGSVLRTSDNIVHQFITIIVRPMCRYRYDRVSDPV